MRALGGVRRPVPVDAAPLEVLGVAAAVLRIVRGAGDGPAQIALGAAGLLPELEHLAVHLEGAVGRGRDHAVLEALHRSAGDLLGLGDGPAELPGLEPEPHVLVADGAAHHCINIRPVRAMQASAFEALGVAAAVLRECIKTRYWQPKVAANTALRNPAIINWTPDSVRSCRF